MTDETEDCDPYAWCCSVSSNIDERTDVENRSHRIRPLRTSDQNFVTNMCFEALFVPPGDAPFHRDILSTPEIAHYHRGFGSRPGDIGRIGESPAGAAVGAAWVRLLTAHDPGYGYVDDATPELTIAVASRHRGRGIGSDLLRDLLSVVGRCCCSVDRRNPAVHLYERLGFETVGVDGESLTMLRSPT